MSNEDCQINQYGRDVLYRKTIERDCPSIVDPQLTATLQQQLRV